MSTITGTSGLYSKLTEHAMFSFKPSSVARASSSSLSDEEDESFLHPNEKSLHTSSHNKRSCLFFPWVLSCLLALILTFSLFYGWKLGGNNGSYEAGFATELQPALSAIALKQKDFYGGIIVNASGKFELVLNPDEKAYVGHPTPRLDAAWDDLVGNYIALNAKEASFIRGKHDIEKGHYLVVPHVRHSLHCLNYLRKALYPKYYPVLHEIRDHIPDYWMHVDHCIETLRETLQCNQDMTPVPHVWSEEKQMYLANTRLPHTCRDFGKLSAWQDNRMEKCLRNGGGELC